MSTAEKGSSPFWRRQADAAAAPIGPTMFRMTLDPAGTFADARALPGPLDVVLDEEPWPLDGDVPEFADTCPEIGQLQD